MSYQIPPNKIFDPTTTWFISDPHFDHKNVLKFESGHHSFETITEHDEAIVDRWNSVVKPGDTVFFLGDLSMPRTKLSYLVEILARLNGDLFWIKGNHDSHVLADSNWEWKIKGAIPIVEFSDYAEIFIKDESAESGLRQLVLFHYPILEFNGKHRGAFHLYGHSHTVIHPIKNAYSVCACLTDYTPVSYEWVKQKIEEHNERLDRLGQPGIR